MDPEAVKALVDRTLRVLGEEIERFGGSIDKFIGDNVMGVFGAPVAHEDDPERAVRAGLAMQEAMEDANRQSREKFGVGFSLRVGINSGEVMAGAVGDRYTVMGDAVNVAARLQAAGRPDTVTVGESTYRASREAIAFERLEPLRLKGKEEPVPAWEANGVLAEPRRGAGRAQTPLIGREEEAGPADVPGRARGARGAPAPGHRDRPGRRGQVAAAPRADDQSLRVGRSADDPARPVPAVWRGHRLLGARGGAQRRVRDPRHRRARGRLGEAPRGRHGVDEGARG